MMNDNTWGKKCMLEGVGWIFSLIVYFFLLEFIKRDSEYTYPQRQEETERAEELKKKGRQAGRLQIWNIWGRGGRMDLWVRPRKKIKK